MLLAPAVDDVKVIARITGTALVLFASGLVVLVLPAVGLGEVDAATALLVGAGPGIILGAPLRRIHVPTDHLTWTRAIVAATVAWVACALVATVPLYLSGHFSSADAAFFDAISGMTNTGHTLVADLDHLPRSFILLRSWLELCGGAAFLLVGQSVLAARRAVASSLDPDRSMGEHVMPRTRKGLVRTGRTIGALFAIGLVAVAIALLAAGMPIGSVAVSTISLVAAAATTGGFVPLSGSVGAYHSAPLEFLLATLMLGAATSVGVLAAAARREYSRIRADLNFRAWIVMLAATLASTMVGLARAGTFDSVGPIARHGLFTTVAAATTTGLSTVDPEVFISDFGVIAPAGLVAAMAIGGMIGSMAGGFSSLRAGILAKGVVGDVRRVLQPEGAVARVGWSRLGRREVLTDAHVRSAATAVMLTIIGILVGAAVLLWSSGSVDLRGALLTGASAVGNVGLDVGVLSPDQPWYVTMTFTALMLLGRLQWLGVFAALGFGIAALRGTR